MSASLTRSARIRSAVDTNKLVSQPANVINAGNSSNTAEESAAGSRRA